MVTRFTFLSCEVRHRTSNASSALSLWRSMRNALCLAHRRTAGDRTLQVSMSRPPARTTERSPASDSATRISDSLNAWRWTRTGSAHQRVTRDQRVRPTGQSPLLTARRQPVPTGPSDGRARWHHSSRSTATGTSPGPVPPPARTAAGRTGRRGLTSPQRLGALPGHRHDSRLVAPVDQLHDQAQAQLEARGLEARIHPPAERTLTEPRHQGWKGDAATSCSFPASHPSPGRPRRA